MHQIFNMPFVSKNFITLLHAAAVSSPLSPRAAAPAQYPRAGPMVSCCRVSQLHLLPIEVA